MKRLTGRKSAKTASIACMKKAQPGRKYDWLRRINPRFAFMSQGTNFDRMTFELGEILMALGIPYAIVSQSAHPWFWPEDDSAVITVLAERLYVNDIFLGHF